MHEDILMKSKYRAVKSFIKSSRQLIRAIDRVDVVGADVKGSLEDLDEGDYKQFSALLEIPDGCERDLRIKLFLTEKMRAYGNYDFWPQDERLKQAEYKRERNRLLLTLLNRVIDLLTRLRDRLGH
jgi:hypothetical protein